MTQKQDFEKHLPQKIRGIHQQALHVSARYKAAEVDLINILDQVDRHRVYLRYGFNSLFQYAVQSLGLADNVAYTFINVTRKSREIPELKAEIEKGALTVSKARKITAVITQENKAHWIELAKTATQSKVEREVAKESPHEARKGRMNFVHPQNEVQEKITIRQQPSAVRIQLQVGVSEKLAMKINRAKELLGQKTRTPVGLESTLEAMVDLYLDKHDPLEKAKRQMIRGKLTDVNQNTSAQNPDDSRPNGNGRLIQDPMTHTCPQHVLRQVPEDSASSDRHQNNSLECGQNDNGRGTTGSIHPKAEGTKRTKAGSKTKKRRPLPAAIKHRVMLKFAARCGHVNHQGQRCSETKFLEVHHIKPHSLGGNNQLENLTLLCSGHHRAQHIGTT